MSNELSIEISRLLEKYTEDVRIEMEKVSQDLTDEAVEQLNETSSRRTGKYAAGWHKKTNKKGNIVIYNKNKAEITHLLEFGHAKKDGGRVGGIPHIKPAEKMIQEKYVSELEKRLGDVT